VATRDVDGFADLGLDLVGLNPDSEEPEPY